MKFVALALALLLAVGSQAAPMMADAPSQLEHYRALADMTLTNLIKDLKDSFKDLEDPEMKIAASEYLDRAYAQIKEGQSKIAPYTDTFVSTIAETAANAQATVDADIAALKLETAQNVENLKNVLEKHRQEYQSLLEPAITEFREKLQPVMTQISEKMVTNVEETKEALLPIIQRVRTKIDEYIESMKGLINPYIEDYKETLMSAPSQAQSIKLEDMTALREKIKPMVDEINNNLQQIFATFSSTFMKN